MSKKETLKKPINTCKKALIKIKNLKINLSLA